MRQIGGDKSTLFSLSKEEVDRFRVSVASGEIRRPQTFRDEGIGGALVLFGHERDAASAKALVA